MAGTQRRKKSKTNGSARTRKSSKQNGTKNNGQNSPRMQDVFDDDTSTSTGFDSKSGRTDKTAQETPNDSKDDKQKLKELLNGTDKVEVDEHPSKSDNDEEENKKKKTLTIKAHKHTVQHKKRLRDRRRTFFVFGTLMGILVALYFGHKSSNMELPDSLFQFQFDNLVNYENFQDVLDSWNTNLAKIIPTNLMSKTSRGTDLTSDFGLGKQLRKEYNLTAKHPVIMVPGVITSGLESWGLTGDEECDSEQHFRKRLWGSYYMLKTMLFNKNCWLKHLKLDPITGLDPPNFKMRAAQGFEATDFFVAGYWIWNKVLQNLGTLGYDPNKMVTAAYDWRLAYLDLEKRDRYFSKVKEQIEMGYSLSEGQKSVLFSHSMGSQVAFYFLKWVEAEGEHYGNGGDGWCNKYIEAFVDISGSLLGAPKAVPALISGEMKDTVQLNELAVYGLESFFSRRERLDLLRTFGGIPSMLPRGGELIWGDHTHSLEDEQIELKCQGKKNKDSSAPCLITTPPPNSYGEFIKFSDDNSSFTITDSINFIMENSPGWLSNRIKDQYSFGVATSEKQLTENAKSHTFWSNPLEVALPNAPDMKIFSIYGVGNPAERSYVYRKENYTETGLNVTIDYDAQPAPVYLTDGDGTLPLITHAMSHKWRQGVSPYNPAGINVTIVELKHEPKKFDMRGGAKTAEHVDVLGSAELNEILLKIAAGRSDLIEEKFSTNLNKWTQNIPFPL